jgi:hypothetical protein
MGKVYPFLTLLISCHPGAEELPIYQGNAQQYCLTTEECPTPDAVGLTVLLTDHILITEGYGHNPSFEDITIEWLPERDDGITGETPNSRHIYIYNRNPPDITGSALVHELLHSYSWWKSDGDPDHSSQIWESTTPDGVEATLKSQIRLLNL